MLLSAIALAVALNGPADQARPVSSIKLLPDLPLINRSTVKLLPDLVIMPSADDALPRKGALGLAYTPLTPEMRQEHNLQPGPGMKALAPIPGLTAEKIGIKDGDIILTLNGEAVGPANIGPMIQKLTAGANITLGILRDGQKMDLSGPMVEKPRDPGNANYSVEYRHVVSNGTRIRTIISKPKKPGKHPALMLIQGFSPLSYDYTLETAKGDVSSVAGPIIYEFANNGYVTMRVEKMGVGDSEGGPFAQEDFITELDIYRQALKQLKETSGVDPNNIFIFGHSMGGAFGPMIASESPVRGIATYGTAARTWQEYLLETMRTQNLLHGATYEQVDDTVRATGRIFALVFGEGMTPDDVKQKVPALAPLVDQIMPGGLYNGKTTKFWAQLGEINFPAYWTKAKTHVLSVRGASDFVTYDSDHELIANVVNKANPGWGKFVSLPNSDHMFSNWATEKESQENWPNGKFSNAFGKLMKEWADGLVAEG